MGDNHDLSVFTREDLLVEFTELARQGKQTPEPYWMGKDHLPDWAAEMKDRWAQRAEPVRAAMLAALEPSEIPKKKKPPPAEKDAPKKDAADKPGEGKE